MKEKITKEKNWNGFIYLFVLFIILNVIIIKIFFLINNNLEINEIPLASWVLLVILLVLDYLIFDSLLWQLRGYEEVELNEKTFTISRKGKLINDKFKIQTSTINSIENRVSEEINFKSIIFDYFLYFSEITKETGGEIIVRYGKKGNKKITFGLGLTDYEAKILVAQMTEILRLHGYAE